MMHILCLPTLKSQCCYSGDSIIYLKAYDYVVTDSFFLGKPINVSEKLIGTSYWFLPKELMENKDRSELLDMDDKYKTNDSLCSNIVNQFEKYLTSNTLCFSKIINNDLFVEIYKGNFAVQFGEFMLYYFIFDSQGNIQNVYKTRMYGL
jgi:hypothetical protein